MFNSFKVKKCRICDNKKLLKCTNWRPSFNLESGLRETILWIEKNLKHYKSNEYVV